MSGTTHPLTEHHIPDDLYASEEEPQISQNGSWGRRELEHCSCKDSDLHNHTDRPPTLSKGVNQRFLRPAQDQANLPTDTVSHSRRHESSASPLWKPAR